ncbi:MAG: hypothetical protein HZA54_09845 [Planctomycetes bacterium]|nr:hypothetical protein [Planctomycetota bacterium]
MPAALVVVGDSLSQGFQNGAICRTDWSYPALLARCLGAPAFRVPDFAGEGGLPLNLEALIRLLNHRYGDHLTLLDSVPALLTVRSFMDRVEDYWERGDGDAPSPTGPLHHNLACWGFDLGDSDTLTEALCRRAIPPPSDDLIKQIPEFAKYRSARRTLNPARAAAGEELTQLGAAAALARAEGGIENLVLFLGANNCLGSVTRLAIRWSEEADLYRPAHQRTANLWTPEHFRRLLDRVAPAVAALDARRVFVATVPHVTIPPVCRGVSVEAAPGAARSFDGYYEYYTHFWIWDADFRKDPTRYPRLTREEARRIDRTIDAYNAALRETAAARGWHVVELCALLDGLAYRRSGGTPNQAIPVDLTLALARHAGTVGRIRPDGRPVLDTRYLGLFPAHADPERRYRGGIFSLDGVHPTTIGYGLIANVFLAEMRRAGATIRRELDWDAIVAADTLVTDTPKCLGDVQRVLAFLSKWLAELMAALG